MTSKQDLEPLQDYVLVQEIALEMQRSATGLFLPPVSGSTPMAKETLFGIVRKIGPGAWSESLAGPVRKLVSVNVGDFVYFASQSAPNVVVLNGERYRVVQDYQILARIVGLGKSEEAQAPADL